MKTFKFYGSEDRNFSSGIDFPAKPQPDWTDGDWNGDGYFDWDTENAASASDVREAPVTVFAPTDRADPPDSIDLLMPIEDVFLFDAPEGVGPASESHADWVDIYLISQRLQRHSPSSSADDGFAFASVGGGEFVDDAERFEVHFVDEFYF